jgi:hypothetical protein
MIMLTADQAYKMTIDSIMNGSAKRSEYLDVVRDEILKEIEQYALVGERDCFIGWADLYQKLNLTLQYYAEKTLLHDIDGALSELGYECEYNSDGISVRWGSDHISTSDISLIGNIDKYGYGNAFANDVMYVDYLIKSIIIKCARAGGGIHLQYKLYPADGLKIGGEPVSNEYIHRLHESARLRLVSLGYDASAKSTNDGQEMHWNVSCP